MVTAVRAVAAICGGIGLSLLYVLIFSAFFLSAVYVLQKRRGEDHVSGMVAVKGIPLEDHLRSGSRPTGDPSHC